MGVNKTSMHGVVAMRVGVAAPLVGEGERAVARLAIRLRNRQRKVDAIVARRESLGWGTKAGKGLKVRIYWAKYFHGMPGIGWMGVSSALVGCLPTHLGTEGHATIQLSAIFRPVISLTPKMPRFTARNPAHKHVLQAF